MAGMPGRGKTNWVGVVPEAADPQSLADFYSALLGWPVAQRDEHGAATLAGFQPQDDCTVPLDPAGHPFCLYLDA